MGMLSKRDDATHKQKVIYSLTEPAIDLVPVMAQLGAWGSRWLPVTEELSVRARLLADGGPALWQRFMAELRAEHLGVPADPPPDGRTVRERLHEAYLAAVRETGLQTRDDAGGSATHSASQSVTPAG
jgi:hypothetical protein